MATTIHDKDDARFNNEGKWPRRLLHVDLEPFSLRSHKWKPGNIYGHQKEPRYNAISYTWGRWELKDRLTQPDVTSLKILGVPWSVPRICASHFTVAELTQAIRRAAEPPEHDWDDYDERLTSNDFGFLWIDIGCIDQRGTPEAKAEIGRQARIFRGAQSVYVWLSQHSHKNLSQIAQNIFTAGNEAIVTDTSPLREGRAWSARWQLSLHENVGMLRNDPWFTSLWCLQEAFLCQDAVLLSKEAKFVKGGNKNIASLRHIINKTAHAYAQMKEQLFSDSQLASQLQPVMDLIQRTGLAALYSENPMTLLPIARFRETTRELDRVYAIMQSFGDNFKVGEAKGGQHPIYSIQELEDEFGTLLLEQYPTLSQMHVYTLPPRKGRGWRISTTSEIPDFAANPQNYDRNDGSRLGDPETVCSLSTKEIGGSVWGYLKGEACSFFALQRLWARFFAKVDEDLSHTNLSIALDRDQALDSMPKLDPRHISPAEMNHGIASELSRILQGMPVMIFMLAREVYGDVDLHDEGQPFPDVFLGMILLRRSEHGMSYLHRLGICKWNSYSAKVTESNDADKATLLGIGNEWQHIEGLFG